MANARYLIGNRTAMSTVSAERKMTADELLEIMCANSSDNKASLYNDSIESVSPGLFWNATAINAGNNNWLEEIVLPNCTSVAYRTFYRCSALKRLILPKLTYCAYSSSFQYLSSIEELDIGNVVTTSKISLTGANVNGFTIYIGDGYYGGTSLEGLLSIPSTVTGPVKVVFNGSKVGDKVLYKLTHQVDVEILDSVTSIGKECFRECTGLTSVTIPNSVTSIGNNCFFGCTGLTSAGPIGGDYDYKFGWRNEIPENAFYGCTGLTSVTIPNAVTSLGDRCFYGCTALTQVTIPDSVTLVGSECFADCTGLTQVTIPESVTSLGGACFAGCTGLTQLTSLSTTPPKTGINCFLNVNKAIPVYVPSESISKYRDSYLWNEFTNIQAIPETN